MSEKIPCTVAILTRNSAETLVRALTSVVACDDVIVCDSGSQDATVEIARAAGARVMTQDSQFLDADGRIIDFGGVRNQTLESARHEWFFFLDADEYVDAPLIEELRAIVEHARPAAYWVPRRYVLCGIGIHYASTYPIQQMRLFHRSIATRFVKRVHERIELVPEAKVERMEHSMYVPLPESVSALKKRWRRYIEIEYKRREALSLRAWIRIAVHEGGVACLYLLRWGRIVIMRRTPRLPASYEWARILYQFQLIAALARTVRRL